MSLFISASSRGDEEFWTSRNKPLVCRWVNDKTGVDALTVLSDGPSGDQPGIYYNIPVGQVLFVSQLCYELTTVSDDCRFELGYTDQPDALGTFVPVTPIFRLNSGLNNFMDQLSPYKVLKPPLRLARSAGIVCVTMRVQANDADARIMAAWHGWQESEPG